MLSFPSDAEAAYFALLAAHCWGMRSLSAGDLRGADISDLLPASHTRTAFLFSSLASKRVS